MIPRSVINLFLGFLLVGCAFYTPSSAPVPEPTPTAWVIQGTLAVAADPYADTERQKAIFDADLNEADVIAIQIVTENRGSKAVLVRPSDIEPIQFIPVHNLLR